METEPAPRNESPTVPASPEEAPSVQRLGNTNEMFGKERAEQLKAAREAKFSDDPPPSQRKIELARRMARFSIR